MSHTGVPLCRPVAFRFALEVTREQHEVLLCHAGAARFAYNHHLVRVRANLEQRRAEASYGIGREQQTPALSWSKVSFINAFKAWKTARAPDSPVNDDGSRGLAWRGKMSPHVFECASVNAAQALANFSNSVTGFARAGAVVPDLEDLLGLRRSEGRPGSVRPHLPVRRVRSRVGPGRQRRGQPGPLGRPARGCTTFCGGRSSGFPFAAEQAA